MRSRLPGARAAGSSWPMMAADPRDKPEQGAGRRAQGAGRRAQGAGRRAQGAGRRAQGAGRRAQGAGRRAQGSHARIDRIAQEAPRCSRSRICAAGPERAGRPGYRPSREKSCRGSGPMPR
ncbi:alanine-zipper protein [Paenirhodobacter sp.]|uniref:alanine-zipper protein n=1 Tax=Paenirhodobacter sp. TaxID=1965326 RepID=UPI003B5110B1